MSHNEKSFQERVLVHLHKGEAVMRPRWHFVVHAALFMVGILLAMLTLLFLVSFLTFTLHTTGVWFLPVFGPRSIGPILWSLPWVLILLAIVFVVLLEFLVRHYAFAYRRPLLYTAFFIVIMAVGGGLILAATPFHRTLFVRARSNQLPVAGPFYRMYADPRLEHIHRGRVVELLADGFSLESRRNERLHIIITPETRFPLGTNIAEGDVVIVFGDRQDTVVRAIGVRRIDPESWEVAPHFRRGRQLRPPMFQ